MKRLLLLTAALLCLNAPAFAEEAEDEATDEG